jgi:sugar phosphate isomerase/epimerase
MRHLHQAISRRHMIQGLAAAGAGATIAANASTAAAQAAAQPAAPDNQRAAVNGRIHQSLVYWCFNTAGDRWDIDRTCQIARELGIPSVEIVGPEHWPTLQRHNLVCAMAPNGMPGAPFMRGLNNPRFQDEVIERTRTAINACGDARFPNVIAFTGFKWRDPDNPNSGEIPRDEAADNCVRGLRALTELAERRNVTVCVEHLNTRDSSHPMKGHPGYQGDDLDWVCGILRRVNSPRVKLLFDVYHVQIMHGDVIRRLEQCRDLIGHVHVAGNPGRGELDDRQEINYPPVMRKLLEMNYRGYVGQEFIPTRNALEGLRAAVRLCDV